MTELACVVMSLGCEPGLVGAVQSLLGQSEDIEIVVVNSAGGEPAAVLAAAGLTVPVVNRPERLFPGAVRNLGIEHTTAPYVAFLEADCLAQPGWAAGRLREHRSGVPAVACALTNAYPDSLSAWAALLLFHAGRSPVAPAKMRLLYGLSLDRTVFEQYGEFREDLRAAEDTEFRERLAGEVQIVWAGDVVSAHRYPTRFSNLVSEAFRRGRLLAVLLGRARRRGPLSLRVTYWGLGSGLQALRIVVRAPRGDRGRLVLAWLLVLPASVAYAAGGLTARLGRYEWEGTSPTGDAQLARSAGDTGVGPSSADVLVNDP